MLAVNNFEVARALRYIWDHFSDSRLQVTEVVANTKLSRRPLEILFKKEVGRTINQEITRYRLEKARALLRHSGQSATEISQACGFTRPNQLHRVFKKHIGLSPGEFKKDPGHRSSPA